jgi:hypothetical protein
MHQSPLRNPYDALSSSYDPYAPIILMLTMAPMMPLKAPETTGPAHRTRRTGPPVSPDLMDAFTGPADPLDPPSGPA